MIHSLKFKSTLTVLALAMLAACGDGSDSALNVTGTAATGLAIDGGAVSVQCKSGTGTATTSSTGTYTVGISNGQGPCLITVVTKDGLTTLRSIAEFSTSSQAVANVTPITNAIVNAIAAAKGTTVAGLIGTQAPTAAEISTAANAVVAVLNTALAAAGWTGGTLTAAQLLSDPAFTAATATSPTAGSVLDRAMDLLIPTGQTELPAAVITSIVTKVAEQVKPTATGATGGTGATGSTT